MASRRGHGEGSIYQRSSDGRWFGSVEIGGSGPRKHKTVSAKTRREVLVKLRALQASMDAGVMPERATVTQWVTHWLDDIASERVQPATLASHRGYVTRWIIPKLGHHVLQDLRSDHVRTMYREMRKKGLSETTIRHCHAVLHRALKVAMLEGRVIRNAADLSDAPQARKNPRAWLEVHEIMQALAGARNSRELARLVCGFMLGLRPGEILGLRWEAIDFEARTLKVSQAAQRQKGKGLVIKDPKSAHSVRTIPLPPPAALALAGWRAESSSGWVFPGFDPEKPEDARRDWAQWKDILAHAGVRYVSPACARPSTASLLGALGVRDKVIADILGHSDEAVTQQHYLHSTEDQRRDGMDRLGRVLELVSDAADAHSSPAQAQNRSSHANPSPHQTRQRHEVGPGNPPR